MRACGTRPASDLALQSRFGAQAHGVHRTRQLRAFRQRHRRLHRSAGAPRTHGMTMRMTMRRLRSTRVTYVHFRALIFNDGHNICPTRKRAGGHSTRFCGTRDSSRDSRLDSSPLTPREPCLSSRLPLCAVCVSPSTRSNPLGPSNLVGLGHVSTGLLGAEGGRVRYERLITAKRCRRVRDKPR